MSNLENAIALASEAHSGQFDKAGQPYILHPLRLMFHFVSESDRIVAVLHDVIEDSPFTLDALKKRGFAIEILNAVDCLTRRDNEDYQTFISRISLNALARKVKIADLKDNLDLTRLDSISHTDLIRIEKYHDALKLLSNY